MRSKLLRQIRSFDIKENFATRVNFSTLLRLNSLLNIGFGGLQGVLYCELEPELTEEEREELHTLMDDVPRY